MVLSSVDRLLLIRAQWDFIEIASFTGDGIQIVSSTFRTHLTDDKYQPVSRSLMLLAWYLLVISEEMKN